MAIFLRHYGGKVTWDAWIPTSVSTVLPVLMKFLKSQVDLDRVPNRDFGDILLH